MLVRTVGQKDYELKDHLGNVRVLVSDRKEWSNGILSAAVRGYYHYYPFGMHMPQLFFPGNTTDNGGYRYGYNGMEKDDEVKGGGNSYDFGSRIYDPRIGRWMTTDPKEATYSSWSPYNYSFNSPVAFVDPDGESPISAILKAVSKAALKKATKEFVEVQVKNRLRAYMSKGFAKQLAKDADDALNAFDQEWWEWAIEFIPVVGDIYGAGKFATQVNAVYSKMTNIEKQLKKIEALTKKVGVDNIIKAGNDIFAKINRKYSKSVENLVETTAQKVDEAGEYTKEVITITKSGKRMDALEVAKAEAGFDPNTWVPRYSNAKDANGKYTNDVINGWVSPDGKREIYIDYDPEKGAHYNWANSNGERGAVLFNGSQTQVDQIEKGLTNTFD